SASRPTKKRARSAVHTGAIAPKTATSPDGTNCSAQKMSAQDVPMLKRPEIPDASSAARVLGNDWRSTRTVTVRIEATATARSNAKRYGGTSATPILIAAQVEPQSSTMTT